MMRWYSSALGRSLPAAFDVTSVTAVGRGKFAANKQLYSGSGCNFGILANRLHDFAKCALIGRHTLAPFL